MSLPRVPDPGGGGVGFAFGLQGLFGRQVADLLLREHDELEEDEGEGQGGDRPRVAVGGHERGGQTGAGDRREHGRGGLVPLAPEHHGVPLAGGHQHPIPSASDRQPLHRPHLLGVRGPQPDEQVRTHSVPVLRRHQRRYQESTHIARDHCRQQLDDRRVPVQHP